MDPRTKHKGHKKMKKTWYRKGIDQKLNRIQTTQDDAVDEDNTVNRVIKRHDAEHYKSVVQKSDSQDVSLSDAAGVEGNAMGLRSGPAPGTSETVQTSSSSDGSQSCVPGQQPCDGVLPAEAPLGLDCWLQAAT